MEEKNRKEDGKDETKESDPLWLNAAHDILNFPFEIGKSIAKTVNETEISDVVESVKNVIEEQVENIPIAASDTIKNITEEFGNAVGDIFDNIDL